MITEIHQINEALTVIRREYGELLKGINPQTVLLAKAINALNQHDLEDCAGLVADLWESCQQVTEIK